MQKIPPRVHRIAMLGGVAFGLALTGGARQSMAASADVPYVGCQTDVMGGVAHYPAPRGSARAIAATPAIGLQLAFYQAQSDGGTLLAGLFAPRNWHCYAYQGAGITELVVAPQSLEPQDAVGVNHPDAGMSLMDIPSDTGPGFSFASQIIAAYFPQHLAAFLEQAVSARGTSASPAAARTWQTDSLQRPDDWSVLITTPSGRQGFGTSGGWLSAGPLLVQSLLLLDAHTFRLRELRIRLPQTDTTLLPYILRAQGAELRGR